MMEAAIQSGLIREFQIANLRFEIKGKDERRPAIERSSKMGGDFWKPETQSNARKAKRRWGSNAVASRCSFARTQQV